MKGLNKFTAIFLVIAVAATSVALVVPQKAEAQSISDILGILGAAGASYLAVKAACEVFNLVEEQPKDAAATTEIELRAQGYKVAAQVDPAAVPVNSPYARAATEVEDKYTRSANKAIDCKESILTFFLEVAKRTLLNRMVNDITDWIRGGGEPRFIQRPGEFFSQVADDAAGFALRDIGVADNMCSTPLRLNIQSMVRSRITNDSFPERIDCSLTEFLGNTEQEVTNFAQDFRNGGFLAYQELLKPQNNRWGLERITRAEVLRRSSRDQNAAQYQASIGSGFLGTQRCVAWEHQETGEVVRGIDTYTSPPDSDAEYTGRTSNPGNSNYVCIQSETATPGDTMAAAAVKSTNLEIDRVLSAEELSDYLAVIIDALISRVTGELLEAGKGLLDADSTNRNEQAPEAPTNADDASSGGNGGGGDTSNSTGSTGDTTPPEVSFTSPSNNSEVSGTVTVSVSASDNEEVSSVEFTVAGASTQSLGTDTNGSDGWSVQWNTTSATNGDYAITAVAEDTSGNQSPAFVQVSVNN